MLLGQRSLESFLVALYFCLWAHIHLLFYRNGAVRDLSFTRVVNDFQKMRGILECLYVVNRHQYLNQNFVTLALVNNRGPYLFLALNLMFCPLSSPSTSKKTRSLCEERQQNSSSKCMA